MCNLQNNRLIFELTISKKVKNLFKTNSEVAAVKAEPNNNSQQS